jgi:hypothetical protein
MNSSFRCHRMFHFRTQILKAAMNEDGPILRIHKGVGIPHYWASRKYLHETPGSYYKFLDIWLENIENTYVHETLGSYCKFCDIWLQNTRMHARTYIHRYDNNITSLSICSSLNLRYQISQPCKTTGKIIVLYVHNLCISPFKKTVSKNKEFVCSVTLGKISVGYSCQNNVRAGHISVKIRGHPSRLALNRFHVSECRFDNCAGWVFFCERRTARQLRQSLTLCQQLKY